MRLTVGQGLLPLQQVGVEGECFYCPPPFSKKSGGTLFLVFRGAW